jgi:predicted glycosyltransferase involved in capsule biosynthesis
MNNHHAFTFIIGYRHKLDRYFNLRRTLEWINGFSKVQVILVEQDNHSKIKHLNLPCQHIFVKSKMPYNRSWAFNVGIKYATSEVIVFGDSDLIMNPDDFINGLKALDNYDMVSPYHSVLDLNQQESNLQIDQMVKIERPGRGETDHQKINISGGITMWRANAIKKIGGWSEDFIGWGGEDDFQTIKVQNFLTWTELKARCFHLYHERVQPDQALYQRTLQILEKAHKMPTQDLLKSINNSMPKIGNVSKYDTF